VPLRGFDYQFSVVDMRSNHFDGQTAPAKRTEMVTAFQQPDDKVNVFLISLKAGNAGLNLQRPIMYSFLIHGGIQPCSNRPLTARIVLGKQKQCLL